mmetsp:Transcript_85091/g.237389  ORF Transcript_85091/g.237389 Transcript_85091/m.237389 type:complete len:402 (+) Transcript_85091:569-1774(+)
MGGELDLSSQRPSALASPLLDLLPLRSGSTNGSTHGGGGDNDAIRLLWQLLGEAPEPQEPIKADPDTDAGDEGTLDIDGCVASLEAGMLAPWAVAGRPFGGISRGMRASWRHSVVSAGNVKGFSCNTPLGGAWLKNAAFAAAAAVSTPLLEGGGIGCGAECGVGTGKIRSQGTGGGSAPSACTPTQGGGCPDGKDGGGVGAIHGVGPGAVGNLWTLSEEGEGTCCSPGAYAITGAHPETGDCVPRPCVANSCPGLGSPRCGRASSDLGAERSPQRQAEGDGGRCGECGWSPHGSCCGLLDLGGDVAGLGNLGLSPLTATQGNNLGLPLPAPPCSSQRCVPSVARSSSWHARTFHASPCGWSRNGVSWCWCPHGGTRRGGCATANLWLWTGHGRSMSSWNEG